uniref:Uncharacterized protein n=1 Tax=Bracon brevicornis TaxID=1563983 RepID=A0A6V7LC72_9HYME
MKIMLFKKRNTREGKGGWELIGGEVEEVSEFCYLGYWLTKDGKNGPHMGRRAKVAERLMRQVWGLGKRRLREDWKRGIWLFDVLVWSVMCYGAEI